jgi:hypothetical protein
MENLYWIAGQEYPGRGILIGRTPSPGEFDLIAYFVTGRSPSSRARRLVEEWDKDRVRTECTDPEQLAKGTPELLIYNAMRRVRDVFVVSNGTQTDIIADEVARNPERSPAEILMRAFATPVWVPETKEGKFTGNYIDLTNFEPDSPNWTPRILGVVMRDRAALAIARDLEGQTERQYFEFPLIPGRAKLICTYSGKNVQTGRAIPCFRGEPLDVELFSSGGLPPVEYYAAEIYAHLGPKGNGEGIVSPGEDFRVGVSAVLIHRQPRPGITSYTKNALTPCKKDVKDILGRGA